MIGWWIGQPFWLIFVDQSNGALAQNFPHLKWQLISDYWVSSSKSWRLGTFHTSRHRCNETSMSTTWITITKSDQSYGKRNKLLCLIDIWHLEDLVVHSTTESVQASLPLSCCYDYWLLSQFKQVLHSAVVVIFCNSDRVNFW